jgi:hypothetical protein
MLMNSGRVSTAPSAALVNEKLSLPMSSDPQTKHMQFEHGTCSTDLPTGFHADEAKFGIYLKIGKAPVSR